MAITIISNYLPVKKGETVQFTATASGIGILRYQWRKRGVDKLPDKVLGDDTLVLKIPDIDISDEGQYYCIVTNTWNKSVESNYVNLIIYGMLVYSQVCLYWLYDGTGPPIITTHPSSQLITSNMSIILDCDVSSKEPVTFKWEYSSIYGGQWITISNSDNRKLVVKTLEQSEQFRCVASNDAGETSSNIAIITVLSK